MSEKRHHWTRRDKLTANRFGHGMLEKPMYPGESYGQRCSFGAFRPHDLWFDSFGAYEFVEIARGRRVAPPGPRYRIFDGNEDPDPPSPE